MTDASSFWTDLGERVCAPLYFSLCHWIREETRRQGIGKILFLARDGLILKKTWQQLYGTASEPEPVYLWASRRCLQMARMRQMGDPEKRFILSRKSLSPAQCLHQLGLDLPEAGCAAGLDWQQPMRSSQDRDTFLAYLDSISGHILEQAREERECLLGYLGSLGLADPREKTVALVDLGWRGNLQAALQELLEDAGSGVQLQGYYMGTIAPVGVTDPGRTRGLFFDHSSPEEPCRTIRHCQLLVETLFAAPHPSIKRIRKEGNAFSPEYVPVDEHADIRESLTQMQDAALAQIRHNHEHWQADPSQPLRAGLKQLTRLLKHPTPMEATILGNVNHFGGFGQAMELRPLAPGPARPGSVWRWRLQYREAYWRSGFLARLKPWQRLALLPLTIGMRPDRS